MAQTFFVEPKVAAFARLDGIITLVDAKHIIQHLDEEKPRALRDRGPSSRSPSPTGFC